MKKHVLHIDKTYPRKLNGAVVVSPSVAEDYGFNWKFNTEADSIEGNITKEANPRPTTVDNNDLDSSDRIFEEDKLTSEQLASIESAKQARFNANVFNYKVHAILDDVLLKYDSPVFYHAGMGKDDVWQSKIIVLKSRKYNYQISFNIYMYDPIGLDAYVYEGYVGNQCFVKILRDNGHTSDLHDYDKAVYWDSTGAHSSDRTIAITKAKYIYSGDASSNEDKSSLAFKIDKLPDMYDADNAAFKIHVGLSGTGYDTDDINSTKAQLAQFEAVMQNEHSTEAEIKAAWDACEGVKYKFFDIAGNVTYWVMPYIEIIQMTLEEMYEKFHKLKLEFVETRPADLDLSTELEGRTKIKVSVPYYELADYPVVIGLAEDSIGTLYPDSREIFDNNRLSETNSLTIVKELVDNIDESGWVKAFAYIDASNFDGDLQFIADMIRNQTYVTGELGEWIKECADNLRKIELLPFVPEYLKEHTNRKSEYTQFVLFTEKYLNRMYKAYDKNCYISVLEAIERIGQMNDPYEIYQNLIDKYDDDHGDMLHISKEQLQLLAEIDKNEDIDEN